MIVRGSVVITIALTVGCGLTASSPNGPSPATDIDASLGREFDVRAGGAARISSEPLTITFERVVADSRCPADTTCVFEGDATVRLVLEGANAERLTLDLHTQANGPREGAFQKYRLRLVRLAPVLQNNSQIPFDQYVATLIVVSG